MGKKIPSMQIVISTNCKVNLRLIVGDGTHAKSHMLSHRCIGQLYTVR